MISTQINKLSQNDQIILKNSIKNRNDSSKIIGFFNPDNSSSSKHFQLLKSPNSFLSKKELNSKIKENKNFTIDRSINKLYHPKTKSISNILYNSNSSFLLKNEISPLKPIRKKSLNQDISELFLVNSFKRNIEEIKPKSKSIFLPKIQKPNPVNVKKNESKFYNYDKYEFLKMNKNNCIRGKNIFKKKYKSRPKISNNYTNHLSDEHNKDLNSSQGNLEDIIKIQLIKSIDNENKDPNSENSNNFLKVTY